MKARQIREWRKDSTEREKQKTRIKVKDIEKPRNFTGHSFFPEAFNIF